MRSQDKMESYLAVLIVVFAVFRISQQERRMSLFVIFLLLFHLCPVKSFAISIYQTSIVYDNPSQDDEKSAQEKKK